MVIKKLAACTAVQCRRRRFNIACAALTIRTHTDYICIEWPPRRIYRSPRIDKALYYIIVARRPGTARRAFNWTVTSACVVSLLYYLYAPPNRQDHNAACRVWVLSRITMSMFNKFNAAVCNLQQLQLHRAQRKKINFGLLCFDWRKKFVHVTSWRCSDMC